MNDNVSVSVAKYEPRIAFVGNPAFGFDDKACLEERMLDAIELRELLVRPSSRRGPLRPRDYRAGHEKLIFPASKGLAFTTSMHGRQDALPVSDERWVKAGGGNATWPPWPSPRRCTRCPLDHAVDAVDPGHYGR